MTVSRLSSPHLDIINDDLGLQQEAKLRLISLLKSLLEVARTVFRSRDHKSSIGTVKAHVKLVFELDAICREALTLQFGRDLDGQLVETTVKLLSRVRIIDGGAGLLEFKHTATSEGIPSVQ